MKLLIVEDDLGLQSQYKWGLKDDMELYFASNREEATKLAKEQEPHIILLDLGLPPDPDNASEGLLFLSEVMVAMPMTRVVVLTGSEQREHALKAASLGAWIFLQKGIELSDLKSILYRAYEMYLLERENKAIRVKSIGNPTLIGTSPAMAKAIKTLSKIAHLPVTTLILGESGTGKELFAQNIHSMSQCGGEFIAINCASIPHDLLESELFGHEKGAFTGAHKTKIGKIERANGGTLFLDEIGDMPLELQSKMLRFLQEREIERLGGNCNIKVNTRVICATHRDLKGMTDTGEFRLDLYYRLAEFTLMVPALRDRESDVITLANFLLDGYKKDFGSRVKGFSEDAITALVHHSFPGNIRELQNRVKGSVIVCEGELISSEDLSLANDEASLSVPNSWINDGLTDESEPETLENIRKKSESTAIFNAYRKSKNNISGAAKMLGITRPTFYALTEKYGMRIKNKLE
jgi:two-component system NtrC family response regulator